MRIYPIVTEDGKRSSAFEIENVYIGPTRIADLLTEVHGVRDVQLRKLFSKSSDIHIEFNYHGLPYIVWEPYGDNSRYWIGPKDQITGTPDVTALEEAFKHYRPPFLRALLGDVLSLKFMNRLIQRREK